jgi:hypothetical protein
MDISIVIDRTYKVDRTLGNMTVFVNGVEEKRFYTLELPWKDNKKEISCIPEGRYHGEPNDTKKYPDTYRVLEVDGRTDILIHSGNYPRHTLGCILTGLKSIDIDKDGRIDVGESKKAMKNEIIGDNNFKLLIC